MLRVSLRSVAAHKARLALSVLAVVLGVAFIAGTLVFSDTINLNVVGTFNSLRLSAAAMSAQEPANDDG